MTILLGGYFSYIEVSLSDEDGKPLVALGDDSFDTIIVSMNLDEFPSVYITSFSRMRSLPPPTPSLQPGF
jgi:hypothetical protein